MVVNFTPREQDVATLILCALPNKEIAREMRISEQTVKKYLNTMCLKIGMRKVSRVKLATYLFREKSNA